MTWQTAAHADLTVVREALETNLLGARQTTLALLPFLRRSAPRPRRATGTFTRDDHPVPW